MKIVEIWESGDSIYTVRFKPNLFKRIFGATEYEEQYKSTGGRYYSRDGSELSYFNPAYNSLDKFRRKW